MCYQNTFQKIFFLLIIGTSSTLSDECIVPPNICPNINVAFFLYTRANPNNPHQLFALNPESITSAPFVPNAPIKLIFHGFNTSKDEAPNNFIRPEYLKCCDYNLISVDYAPLAPSPCYIQAVSNADLVANCTAQLVDAMVKSYGFDLKKFHVIGFSLGGQIAGLMANFLKSGKLERTTALDPALPLFITLSNKQKLDSRDAKFVDVLHTNAGIIGKLERCGTVDFYANGGLLQPGCVEISTDFNPIGCSHNRAPELFAESINTQIGFYAKKCPDFLSYTKILPDGICDSKEILFGEYVPINATGTYFFNTNSAPRYAKPIESQSFVLNLPFLKRK